MLPDGYQSLTDPPQPPHELYFFRPNGRKRELLGEGPHGKYVVGSTAYLLHATKQWNKRIKYITGRAGVKIGRPLLAVFASP